MPAPSERPTRTSETDSLTGPRTEMRVYLLGTPEVRAYGRLWTIPRRQARALLYRLASQHQPVSRDQLVFLFWPDQADAAARRNLTRLLTHLKRALPRPGALVVAGAGVTLDLPVTCPRRPPHDRAYPGRGRDR